ncbi:MAG: serine/threonine protein kinase [Candidatus Xenobiia bacterium LiM19]
MLRAGDIIKERYRVLKPIGEGASGKVYLVEDGGSRNELMALKELTLTGASPDEIQEFSELFQREIAMLQSMKHKGLPLFIDSFSLEDSQFLVMEYIEGETLDEVMERKGRPFTAEELIPLACQLASILEYLHTRKPHPVIYRDLKPSNIMLTVKETLKLIDFGIARHYNPKKLRDTHFMGTPGFSPPEQYGKGQSDVRTDMFSLGATLYFLLTGEDMTRLNFSFPPIRTLVKDVPQELEDIIMRCLSINPGERFQTTTLLKHNTMMLYYRNSGPLGFLKKINEQLKNYCSLPGWLSSLLYGFIGAFLILGTLFAVCLPGGPTMLLLCFPLLLSLAGFLLSAILVKKLTRPPAAAERGALCIIILLSILVLGKQCAYYMPPQSREKYKQDFNENSAPVYDKNTPVNGSDASPSIYNYNWGISGLPVTALEGSQHASFSFLPDEPSSIVIAFVNTFNEKSGLYLQRISSEGKRMWTENGLLLRVLESDGGNPVLISDSTGGWYVTWCDRKEKIDSGKSPLSLYMQRVDEKGNILWAMGGIEVSDGLRCSEPPGVTSDSKGGIILTWADSHTIMAQRIDSEGRKLWGSSGVTLRSSSGPGKWLNRPQLASDDRGGAIIVWEDAGNNLFPENIEAVITNFDLYAQRINAEGYLLWDKEGIPVCRAQYAQRNCRVIRDGKGGTIIAWEDYRDHYSSRIYLQALSPEGGQRWEGDGIVATCRNPREGNDDDISSDTFSKHIDLCAIPDGNAGIIVAWTDEKIVESKIGMQRFDYEGNKKWGEKGIKLGAEQARTPSLMAREWIGDYLVCWREIERSSWYGHEKALSSFHFHQIREDGSQNLNSTDFSLSPPGRSQYAQQMEFWGNDLYIVWTDFSEDRRRILAQRLFAKKPYCIISE